MYTHIIYIHKYSIHAHTYAHMYYTYTYIYTRIIYTYIYLERFQQAEFVEVLT